MAVNDLNSTFLEVDEKYSTKNSEEINDENYDEFRKNNQLLLAEVGDTMRQISRMMTRIKIGKDCMLHSNNSRIVGLLRMFHW